MKMEHAIMNENESKMTQIAQIGFPLFLCVLRSLRGLFM